MIPLSILDLAPICEGGTVKGALEQMLALARQADDAGFERYWLAEHHGMPGIASAATAVLIGQAAAATRRIRVGAGGIMLPNHSPLMVAEQFGTLESLFPGRIDLGLGRAPGSDRLTALALRRSLDSDPDAFPRDVMELQQYFSGEAPVRAIPGEGCKLPLWILGSSLFGAQLAALLGLPYAFASHFAPRQMMEAIQLYRRQFRPSAQLQKPHVMLACNVFAADTREQAHYLATSWQQAFVQLRSGHPGRLPAPIRDYPESLPADYRAMLSEVMACSAIGTAADIRAWLEDFIDRTQADELILTGGIHDPEARLHSWKIVASLID